MYVIFKTAFATIKRRKAQSILISIIMILISLLLYTGISMINQTSPFNTMFERANATESILILPSEGNNIQETTKWWQDRKEVKDTITYESSMINGEFELNGNTETELMLLTEYIVDSKLDLLYEDEKNLAEIPVGNNMLINYNFAKGRDLEIGDTINFRYGNEVYVFQVSGFVVDPHFSNAFISPNRCFISPGFFKENNITSDAKLLSIKYYDIDKVDDNALYEAYNKEVVNFNNPIFLGFDTIVRSYSIILGIIASILLGVSFFIFIIVVFVIRSTIHNLILQQYKQIGVKKVIGYTNKQIRNSMLMIYGIIGLISSTIGAFLGLPIRRIINAGINYDIQVDLTNKIDIFLPLTVIIIVSLITLFAYLATRKANKIKPVQAIKYGMPEKKVSNNRFSIITAKKTPLSVALSIKQLLAHRSRTITTTLLITLLIYVALVIFNTGGTLAKSDHLASHLLGIKVGDFTVTDNSGKSVEDAISIIQSMDEAENVVYFNYKISDSTQALDGNPLTLTGQIIYGNSPDDLIVLAEGRQPVGTNEIALSTDVVKETGKSTGDYITIKSEDENTTYLISGTYNSVSFSGVSYTMIQKNIPSELDTNGKLFWIYSNEKRVIIEELDNKIKTVLGNDATVSKYDSNVKNILSTVSSFPIVIQSLLFIFLIVSGVIILNSTIMDINNSTKDYGIMKAIGFDKGIITRVLVIRTLIMTAVGSVFGFILNMLSMNSVMQAIFKVTPFSSIELPVIFNLTGSLSLLALFVAIGILGTLIPARKIGRISPRLLISE